MTLKKFGTSALTICIGLAAATVAHASCIQADAAGNWQAYAVSSNGNVTRCKITVNSSGLMSNNTCTQYFSSSSQTGVMTGGKINLSAGSTCTFTGSFNLGGAVNLVRHLTISKDKISAEGIGTFSGGAFSLNLTKL